MVRESRLRVVALDIYLHLRMKVVGFRDDLIVNEA